MPKSDNAPRKKSYLLIGIVLFLIVAAGIYVLQKIFQSEPRVSRELSPRVLPADVSEFFSTLRESIRNTTVGKKHYLTGLKLLNSPGETAPSGAKERFSPAAENFSSALEHFRLAEKSLKDLTMVGMAEKYKKCEDSFYVGNDKYIEAAKLMNDHAKGWISGEEKKIVANPPTDAAAKFEMAEKLMTQFLIGGCQGEYLKYLSNLDSEDKALVFLEYKNFFEDKFSVHEGQFCLMIGYQPALASSPEPAGSPQPAP